MKDPNHQEREKNNRRTKIWRKENPERVKYTGIKRRAKVAELSFTISFGDYVKNFYDKECIYCGGKTRDGIDRINNNIGYELENCVPCCWECNTTKSNKTLEKLKNHLSKMIIGIEILINKI